MSDVLDAAAARMGSKGPMFLLKCTLTGASNFINGMAFKPVDGEDGAVVTVEAVGFETALTYRDMPGWSILDVNPAPVAEVAPAPAPVLPAAPAAEVAPAPLTAAQRRAAAQAVPTEAPAPPAAPEAEAVPVAEPGVAAAAKEEMF